MSASQFEVAVRGQPEVRHGLWDRKLAKWSKLEAEEKIEWRSSYQRYYTPKDLPPDNAERKFVPSNWRRKEGYHIIGNPHVLSTE